MATIQQAIDLATDKGITVTDYYTTKRKGAKVGAFKCIACDGFQIEVKQTEKVSRTWTICQKGIGVLYGSQAECIIKCVEWLTK